MGGLQRRRALAPHSRSRRFQRYCRPHQFKFVVEAAVVDVCRGGIRAEEVAIGECILIIQVGCLAMRRKKVQRGEWTEIIYPWCRRPRFPRGAVIPAARYITSLEPHLGATITHAYRSSCTTSRTERGRLTSPLYHMPHQRRAIPMQSHSEERLEWTCALLQPTRGQLRSARRQARRRLTPEKLSGIIRVMCVRQKVLQNLFDLLEHQEHCDSVSCVTRIGSKHPLGETEIQEKKESATLKTKPGRLKQKKSIGKEIEKERTCTSGKVRHKAAP